MNRLRMNVQFLKIERKGREKFGFASEFRIFERTLAISITGSTFELFEKWKLPNTKPFRPSKISKGQWNVQIA